MPKKLLTDKQKQDIYFMYVDNKLSSNKIAKELNINLKKVLEFLKENNLTRSREEVSKSNASCKKKLEVDIEKAIQLIEGGLSLKQTAKLLGVNTKTLRRRGVSNPNVTGNRVSKYKKNFAFFEQITTEEQAYFLGLLYADGSIDKKGNLRLELQINDGYLVEKLRDVISPDAPVFESRRVRYYKGEEKILVTKRFVSKSNEWIPILEKVGMMPNKTYKDLSIPNLNKELIPHFIRGLFDGDGSIYCTNKQYIVTFTGNFNLNNEIHSYLKNKELTLNRKVYKKPNQADSVLSISNKESIYRFFKLCYLNATIFMERKYNKFMSFLDYYKQPKVRQGKRYFYDNKNLNLYEWAEKINIPVETLYSRLSKGWSIEKTLTTPTDSRIKYIEYKGKRKSIKEWEKELGFSKDLISQRLKRGWDIDKAFNTLPKQVNCI